MQQQDKTKVRRIQGNTYQLIDEDLCVFYTLRAIMSSHQDSKKAHKHTQVCSQGKRRGFQGLTQNMTSLTFTLNIVANTVHTVRTVEGVGSTSIASK